MTVLTMIDDDLYSLSENRLSLLKGPGDELKIFNQTTNDQVIEWIGDCPVVSVFVYDSTRYEAFQVEKIIVNGFDMILFTFDADEESVTDPVK